MSQESPGIWRATEWPAMLAALDRGARGRRKRPDVARFLMDAELRLLSLQLSLRRRWPAEGAWLPTPGQLRHICDPKPRTITVVPFADRVVHQAIMAEVEPELERGAVHHSYACRPGKGQHRALRQAQHFARRHPWCLRLDVRRFFASIPRDRLVAMVHRTVRDRGLAHLLSRIVRAPSPGLPDDRGIPVGSLTSQHLANAYLSRLDHHLLDDLGFSASLRYMDDVAVFGDKADLLALRSALDDWLPEALGLQWNQRVCQVHRTARGVPWLGWSVAPDHIRPRARTWTRWSRKIRRTWAAAVAGQLDEEDAVSSVTAAFAHLLHFDTGRQRRQLVAAIAAEVSRAPTSNGSNRVNRGGSWNNNPTNARVANRNRNAPGNRNDNLGVRLASASPGPKPVRHGAPVRAGEGPVGVLRSPMRAEADPGGVAGVSCASPWRRPSGILSDGGGT